MGSLSANAVGSSSLANETVHVSILSADQTKNERNITGRIIDGDTGEALIGVSILVKGASMGTVTDVDGKFSLSVATGDVLEISYIGYKSQSIVVGNQSVLAVSYTHLRAHETGRNLVCRLLLEKKKQNRQKARMPSSA